jgi:hypothetical protein
MELNLLGLHVHCCTHWLKPCNPPRIWAHLGGCYWSAKIDDISLWPPDEIIPIWFEERPVVESLLTHSLDMKIEILNIAHPIYS